jgi:hypothetical protein
MNLAASTSETANGGFYNARIMTINFKTLIKDSGEKLTQRGLAREMVAEGLFKSVNAAVNMMQYSQNGIAKSCDWELLKYLCKRFDKKGADIIQWDE